ncbi:hypothetical protein MMC17_009724 [Xylographa soralifera]|nr:hypothetical protein [Xylographa soralifera]
MCTFEVYRCHCGEDISNHLQERCEKAQRRLSHIACPYDLPESHRIYREGYLCENCKKIVRLSITAVDDPANQNGASHEDDPRTAKTILKQIHTRLHNRLSSQGNEHRDADESGSVMKMVRRACRKLHIGKECSVDENGKCRYDQVQALQELLRKDTTDPITDEESRIINECIATMSGEQAAIVESWFKKHREQPPDYTERLGGEAEASGSAPGPSRRMGSESHDTVVAEHAEQGGEVEASESASRPSEQLGSILQDTDEAENVEQSGEVEASGSASRPSMGGEEQASGSISRPSRRAGSGSHDTNVTEHAEYVEQGEGEGGEEGSGSGSRSSGRVGCIAEHTEHTQQGGDEADASKPTPGPPNHCTLASHDTNDGAQPLRGGDQAEASGSASRPRKRVKFESHDSEGDDEEERPGKTPSIGKLMKRVRGKLHIA